MRTLPRPAHLATALLAVAGLALAMSSAPSDASTAMRAQVIQAETSASVTARPAAAGTADIAVTLTATPSPVVSGNGITYVATVVNHGPDTAVNVQLFMPVLPGAVFLGYGTSRGTCKLPARGTTGNVFCSLGNLAAVAGSNRAQVRVSEQVRVLSGVTREQVKIHTASSDPNQANNLARLVTTVSPRNADLSLSMSAPTQVAVGGTITYVMTAHNDGPNASLGTVIYDRVPKGTTFQSATTSQGSCATPAVGHSGVLRCTLGRFAHGTAPTVRLSVNETATGGTIRNLANIAAVHTTDPNHGNNFAAAATSLVDGIVLPPASITDLGVRITADPPNPRPGQDVTFILAVANAGPDAATSVNLSSAVPAGSTFVSITSTQGTCSAPAVGQGGTVDCAIGALDPVGYATARLTVHVTANYGSRLQGAVTAVHGLNAVDPTPLDEAATLSIPVADNATIVVVTLPTADIAIQQVITNSADNVDHVTHTFLVTNAGPATATDVKFSVVFAPNVTPSMTDWVINKGSCVVSTSSAGTTFNCDVGSMSVGPVVSLTVPTDVDEAALLNDAPNLTIAEAWQRLGLGVDLAGPFQQTFTQPSMVSAATATITSISGPVDPNDLNNETFAIAEPKPFQIIATYESGGHCKNKDMGHFAALLQIDCGSPVDVVTTWASTVASLAASSIGNGVLAAIVYYTVEAVAVAAEEGLIVTSV